MQYLLLLYGDADAERKLGPDGRREIVGRHMELSDELRAAGAHVLGAPLGEGAATVRGRLVTDGPFAETKEQLGGFYLLECPSLDEALAWAKKVPESPGLVVEMRPLAEL